MMLTLNEKLIHNVYVRTNMLIQRFRNGSQHVKMAIFRAYCICLYGVALWSHFSSCILINLNTAITNV